MERRLAWLRRHPTVTAAIVCAVLSAFMFYLGWLSRQPHAHPLPALAPASLAYPSSRRAANAAVAARMQTTPSQSPPAARPSAPPGAGSAAAGALATDYGTDGQGTGPAKDVGGDNPFEPVTPGGSRSTGTDASTRAPAAEGQIQAAIKSAGQGVGRENPFNPVVVVASASDGPTSRATPMATASGSSTPRGASRAAASLPPIPPLDPSAPLPGDTAAGRGPALPTPRGPAAPSGLRLVGFVTGPAVLALIEDGGRSILAKPGDVIRPGLRVVAVDAERQTVRLEWQGAPLMLWVGIPTPP
jgi:hypothetical protein